MPTLGPLPGVALLGAGAYLPGAAIDNADVLRRLPAFANADDERLRFAAEGVRTSLGLQTRHWTHEPGTPLAHGTELTTVDLAVEAARRALADAGVEAASLPLVIATTSTPHRMTSTLSAAVAAALGANEAAAMDVRTGCAAGLFALQTAATYLQHTRGPVLVVGAETFSKVLPSHHKMALLSLGDGAGALVLGRRRDAILRSLFVRSDGNLGGLITTDGALPPTADEITRGGYVLSGAPEELASVLPGKYAEAIGAVRTRSRAFRARALVDAAPKLRSTTFHSTTLRATRRALREAWQGARVLTDPVDLYVPHTTSRPLVEGVANAFAIPLERVWMDSIARHANLGSAGWLASLAAAREAGRAPAGTELLVAAVGGGMSWGAARWRI
ncbi:MAG: hypothetical protein H6721_02570 [Sandaracinus sp.]|nr:hypothetical protein [Sandaracinus sp.]MCB9631017.1 hypothetical protein [Sandaracinus sp.]